MDITVVHRPFYAKILEPRAAPSSAGDLARLRFCDLGAPAQEAAEQLFVAQREIDSDKYVVLAGQGADEIVGVESFDELW
ncbi:unnamed protein product, partial [Symbiodinium sp. KB8]